VRLALVPPTGNDVPVIEWFKRLGNALGLIAVGTELAGVTINAAETQVAHGLRSRPRTCRVLPYADARVWRTRAPDDTFVYLQASTQVQADVWCY